MDGAPTRNRIVSDTQIRSCAIIPAVECQERLTHFGIMDLKTAVSPTVTATVAKIIDVAAGVRNPH